MPGVADGGIFNPRDDTKLRDRSGSPIKEWVKGAAGRDRKAVRRQGRSERARPWEAGAGRPADRTMWDTTWGGFAVAVSPEGRRRTSMAARCRAAGA